MEKTLYRIKDQYLLEVQKNGQQYNFDVKIVVSSDNNYKGSAVDLKNSLIIGWSELKEINLDDEMYGIIENALNNL